MSKNKLIIEPKSPKGEDGHITFSIRIKTELADKIQAITAQTGHSRNELISLLLDYAVLNCEINNDSE
ncbi:MAG: CopG family transcriptional regulator [Clostridia bacterium]